MTKIPTYTSKDDVYADGYVLAIKFAFRGDSKRVLGIADYDDLHERLRKSYGAKLDLLNRYLKNYKTEYPHSVAYVLEAPVPGDTGTPLGTRYILLHHEFGPELFILHPAAWAAVAAAGGYVGAKIADEVIKKLIGSSLSQLLPTFKSFVDSVRGMEIDHVELRSEDKGCIRVAFHEFEPKQITCLLDNFNKISKLMECNKTCFNSRALPVDSKSEESQLAKD
jgi:hypothetical protein